MSRTHESTRKLARRIQAGTARILSATHLLDRLSRDIETTASPALISLGEELAAYPCPQPASRPDTLAILVPLRLRVHSTVLSLFSTTTVFGTPREVTLSELAIESFYPADPPTADFLRSSAAR